jgi:hypothetical protein
VPLGGNPVRRGVQGREKPSEQFAHGFDPFGAPAVWRRDPAIGRHERDRSLDIELVDRREQLVDGRLVH